MKSELNLSPRQIIRMFLSLTVIVGVFGIGLEIDVGWVYSLLASSGASQLFNITLSAILDYHKNEK